jgi:AcrR family transcriptional regulator
MYCRCSDVKLASASDVAPVIATRLVSDGGDHEVSMTRGERRRQEIIDVALRMFAENGFSSTGLIPIAKEVGISHAGILHHFGTKVGLLEAVVHERDAFASLFERWFESRPGLEPIEHLVEFAEVVIERPLVIKLMTNLVVENLEDGSPLRQYFFDRDQRVRDLVAERVAEAQRTGIAHLQSDPALVGRGVLGFTIGANAQWLVDRDDDVLRGLYRNFSALLLASLLA